MLFRSLEALAIDEEAFGLLAEPLDPELARVGEFWMKRAHIIATDLLSRIVVQAPQ